MAQEETDETTALINDNRQIIINDYSFFVIFYVLIGCVTEINGHTCENVVCAWFRKRKGDNNQRQGAILDKR